MHDFNISSDAFLNCKSFRPFAPLTVWKTLRTQSIFGLLGYLNMQIWVEWSYCLILNQCIIVGKCPNEGKIARLWKSEEKSFNLGVKAAKHCIMGLVHTENGDIKVKVLLFSLFFSQFGLIWWKFLAFCHLLNCFGHSDHILGLIYDFWVTFELSWTMPTPAMQGQRLSIAKTQWFQSQIFFSLSWHQTPCFLCICCCIWISSWRK